MTVSLLVAQPLPDLLDSQQVAASSTDTYPWRYTVNGWEDSRQWTLNANQIRVTWIDDVHPALWASLVVLAGLIAMIALSDDVSCDRLLRHPADDE